MQPDPPPTRKLTIVAKDPGLRLGGPNGPMAFVEVDVPAELLAPGPTGYRIKVVDYNASEGVAYKDVQTWQKRDGTLLDPFAPDVKEGLLDPAYQARALANPNFHAQNAYAIAMRTLGVFERALGRRVAWSSRAHQLNIAPHAFAHANAFYSEPDGALMFGYFRRERDNQPIFTSLSHDIVAHETTHAILDGLRSRFTEPSGPDQAAFHEGFADIVALLSVFSLEPVVAAAIGEDGVYAIGAQKIALVKARKLKPEAIRKSIFGGLAAQFGSELEQGERNALRRSVELEPSAGLVASLDMTDEHARGEIIVAAVMQAFIGLWCKRIEQLGKFKYNTYNLGLVIEEGAKLAQQLLTICIRGIDYCPPTDLDFSQYLAALLTADSELVPDDSRFGYRKALRDSFKAYGIDIPKSGCDPATGIWLRFEGQPNYSRSNYAALTRDKDEFFRFLWENRAADKFNISERAFTEVLSIDSSSRIGPDGILLHETICQYVQQVQIYGAESNSILGFKLDAGELKALGLTSQSRITAFGGGVIVLDQYGRVKYHIANRLKDGDRQAARVGYLLETGQLTPPRSSDRLRFAIMHQKRMGG
jgi:hypothetical protein